MNATIAQGYDIEKFKHMVADLLYLQSIESVRAEVVRGLIHSCIVLDPSLEQIYITMMLEKQDKEGIYVSGNRSG